MASTTTADIGELIRDMIEDTDLFGGVDGIESPRDHVETVDISDPHNPRIVMASGAVFVARIVREG